MFITLNIKICNGHNIRIILSHIGSILLVYVSLVLIAREDLEECDTLVISGTCMVDSIYHGKHSMKIRGQTLFLAFTKNL